MLLIVSSLILLLFVGASVSNEVIRDGRLETLADLLNGPEAVHIFKHWTGSIDDTNAFLGMLEPWVVYENVIQLHSRSISMIHKHEDLHCDNPLYESVLTGNLIPTTHRLIVDWVPFGYDVDRLLVRLHETHEFTDAYVIYEMPYTMMGITKPLYFPTLVKQERFAPFVDKIIYITPAERRIGPLAAIVRRAVDALAASGSGSKDGAKASSQGYKKGDSAQFEGAAYSIMHFFNRDMVSAFKDIGNSDPATMLIGKLEPETEARNLRLKNKVMDHLRERGPGSVLGSQNDGDELINSDVLHHLKECEFRKEVSGNAIFMPCFGFKNNFNWLQTTYDMRHFTSGMQSKSIVGIWNFIKLRFLGSFTGKRLQNELNQFVWKLGPYVWPLDVMLDGDGGVRRRNFTTDRYQNLHMGYGAATHMSAVNEPAEVWWKSCGTPENIARCSGAIPKPLVEAGANGAVTPELIFKTTIFPWCNSENPAVHVSQLSAEARQIVEAAVPWVVKNNPAYFPFSNPSTNLATTGLFAKCASTDWAKECTVAGIVNT